MRILAAAAFVALTSTAALAGPQYVNETGYANSGYDVVAYFDMDQSAVGEAQPTAIPGSADYTAEYNGATFAFATAANLARFEADPARYAPQFDGHCAYGVAKGGKVPGNPDLWRIVDGKLYLNVVPQVVTFWEEDIPGNLELADTNWDELEGAEASTRVIPNFTPTGPRT